MDAPRYPAGTVRALIDSDLLTPATRAVIVDRLQRRGGETAAFFSEREFLVLRGVCCRLLAQEERGEWVDVAAAVDERLARGEGDGWRYAELPGDGQAYRAGLGAIDAEARGRFGAGFVELDVGGQEEVLSLVQRGEVAGPAWRDVPAARFFEEMLSEVVALYYSHPLAQEEIGYVGMADARGWPRVGPGELEGHEPRPVGGGGGRGANGSRA